MVNEINKEYFKFLTTLSVDKRNSPNAYWLYQVYNILNKVCFGRKLGSIKIIVDDPGNKKFSKLKLHSSFNGTPEIIFSHSSRTQLELIQTLAHQMCHIWVYNSFGITRMYHGTEFKFISNRVNYMSGGIINIGFEDEFDTQHQSFDDSRQSEIQKRLSNYNEEFFQPGYGF